MISDRLIGLARCPDCRGRLDWEAQRGECSGCGRDFAAIDGAYLDLRPGVTFDERTKYLDESLHAVGRHERVAPPLLSAGIRYHMLRRLLPVGAGDRLVDLGCGSGSFLWWLRDSGAYVSGIDVSSHFAPEVLERIDVMVGDLRRLPIADGAFTKAITLDVLEHLTRDGLRAVLREAHRVLGDNGSLFVYTHVRKNAWVAAGTRLVGRLSRALERMGAIDLRHERLRKSDHLNPLSDHDDLHRVAAESGFRIDRIRYYTPLVGALIENVLLRVAERWMVRRAAGNGSGGSASPAGDDPFRTARRDAKRVIARGGLVYRGLVLLTWLMRLDVLLFGRIRSGPFFAVLIKEGNGRPADRGAR